MSEIFSLSLERAVLGSLIKYTTVFPEIDNFLTEYDFYHPTHQTIYCIIRNYLSKGEKLDQVVLAQQVKNLNISTVNDEIDIFDYIRALTSTQITEKGAIESCKELVKFRIRREIVQTAEKVKEFAVKSNNKSFDELITGADAIYNEKISSYGLTNQPEDLFSKVEQIINERANDPREESGLITPYQEFNKLFGGIRSNNGVYFVVSRAKSGKALEENTLLPTPKGWVKIKNLKAGDEVFSEIGEVIKVVGVNFWENRNLHKITTTDGYEIIADEEHEWIVRPDYHKPNEYKTLTSKEISNIFYENPKHRSLKLPKQPCLKLSEKQFIIDPYVLGLWLGDGTSENGMITATTEDAQFYINELSKRNYIMEKSGKTKFRYNIINLKSKLRLLNLLKNKHIPLDYFRGSIAQRMDLVKGLMDSDGYVSKFGECEFCNTNRQLAEDFLELVNSLGIKASIKTGLAQIYGKICGTKYRVLFFSTECVLLPRKSKFLKKSLKKPNRYIKSEKLPFKGKTVCIQVDSPKHMFLCGKGMLPTCNSTWLMNMAKGIVLLNPRCKVLYLDTEMDIETNCFRAAASETDIPMWYLETGNWIKNKDLVNRFQNNKAKLDQYKNNIFHLKVSNKPIEEVCSIVRRFYFNKIGRGNPMLLIYDYLKLTNEKLSSFNQEYQAMGQKMQILNDLGSELNIPIWSAGQQNRQGEDEESGDNGMVVALSDRLSWFAAWVGSFRKKWDKELAEHGLKWGTHLLAPLYQRFGGREAQGFFDKIKIPIGDKKFSYKSNFINYSVNNFQITEIGTLRDIVNEKKDKIDLAKNSKVDSDGSL